MSNSKDVISFVKKRKANLIKVFGEKCCICNFNSFQEALEFHHIDGDDKNFTIAYAPTKALEKQLLELKKCILVCSNCHRGIHAGHIQPPEDYIKFYKEEIAEQLKKECQSVKEKTKFFCKKCGKEITYRANLCVSCNGIEQRVVKERPSKEELKVLIKTQSFCSIGRSYGVTDNTIRKWCISENLPSKKQEINNYSKEEWEKI